MSYQFLLERRLSVILKSLYVRTAVYAFLHLHLLSVVTFCIFLKR